MGALVGTMKKKDLKIYLFFRLSLDVRSSVSLAIGEYYHLSGGGGGGGGGESEDFDRIITPPPPHKALYYFNYPLWEVNFLWSLLYILLANTDPLSSPPENHVTLFKILPPPNDT